MKDPTQFLNDRAVAFSEGRLQEMVAPLDFPLPIYGNGEVVVVHSQDQMMERLARRRRDLGDAGYARTVVDIVSVRQNTHHKVRLVALVTSLDKKGRIIDSNLHDYFLYSQDGGEWRISMVSIREKYWVDQMIA